MGFGYLFLGFFMLLSIQLYGIDVTPDFIGCLLMYAGLRRLTSCCPANKYFSYAKIASLPMAALAFAVFCFQIVKALGELPETVERLAYTPLVILMQLILGALSAVLMIGIHALALEVELAKLANRARTGIMLTGVYYVLIILSKTGATAAISKIAAEPDVLLSLVNAVTMLLGLVWFFAVWTLIFSCYAKICLEGDEDMPYRDNFFDHAVTAMKGKKHSSEDAPTSHSSSGTKKKHKKKK